MSPLISIIIPVYNAADTLRECLSSVLAQSYDNLEIICVDDSSTDDSVRVLEEFSARDQKIRVICQEKSNAGVARNTGYDVSRGEYVLFLDADDIFAPDMVESLARGLAERDADIAVCGWIDFENGKDIPLLGEGEDEWREIDSPATSVDVYERWLGWAWNKLIRRSLVDLNELRFQSLRSSNDLDFSFSALICARRVVQTPRRLVAHRKSSQTLSVTRDRDPLCFAEALRKHYAFLCKKGLVPENAALTGFFRHYVLVFSCWHLDTIRTDENYDKIYRELQSLLVEFSVADAARAASPSDVFFARYRCMRDHPTTIAYLRAELASSIVSAHDFARERDALQAEASGLRAEKDALQAEASGLRAERDALQAEASGLRAERDALLLRVFVLRADVAKYQAENAELRAEKDALDEHISHINAISESLIRKLERILEMTKAHVAMVKSQIELLENDIRVLENRKVMRIVKCFCVLKLYGVRALGIFVRRIFRKDTLPDILFHKIREHIVSVRASCDTLANKGDGTDVSLTVNKNSSSTDVALERQFGKELSQEEFARHVSSCDKGIFVLGSLCLGWNDTFKQRHHHIAEYLRSRGYLIICAMNPIFPKDRTSFAKLQDDGIVLVNMTDRAIRGDILRAIVLNARCRVFFHLIGTEPGWSIEEIKMMQSLGGTIFYDYCDELSKDIFFGLSDEQVTRHKYLLSDDNVIVCASAQKLYDHVCSIRNRNVFLVRNAVNLDDWNYDVKRDGIPVEMFDVLARRNPIVGFYGSFAPWLDYDFIKTLALQRPTYSIVMIGYDYEHGEGAFAKSKISELDNVFIIPAQKYKDLKKFSYYFDVCMLPFRLYELSDTVSPVKMFEYMAQGKPVVASALEECKGYKSVLLAENADEFVSKVDKAMNLRHDKDYLSLLYTEASENTWQIRGEQVLMELEKSNIPSFAIPSFASANIPLLSVGIPLYNMERLISRCLDSLLPPCLQNQMNLLEIIVVNDGSTDSSLNIAREYERKYPNIVRIIDKPNGGHGSCINAAVRAAKGRYFKLIDSDDYVDSFALLLHLVKLWDSVADVLICDYQQVYESGERKVVPFGERLESGVFARDIVLKRLAEQYDWLSYVHMHALTYRTEILKGIRITEHSFFVDQEYITYPLKNVGKMEYQPICLYKYQLGRKGQSVDPTIIRKRIGQNLNVMKNIMQFYEGLPKNSAIQHYVQGILYNQSWYYLKNSDNEEGLDYVRRWWVSHINELHHPFVQILDADFPDCMQMGKMTTNNNR